MSHLRREARRQYEQTLADALRLNDPDLLDGVVDRFFAALDQARCAEDRGEVDDEDDDEDDDA